jgi:hypothetical protein
MKNRFNLNKDTQQVIVLTIISAALAGAFYFYRTNYLELTNLEDNIFRALRMTCIYVILPFGWAWVVMKLRWADFGISKKHLTYSVIFGIGVYSIALVTFILSLGNPDFDSAFRWGANYSLSDWILTLALVSWMAFVTDLWTRGFVLMLLTKYQSPMFGIIGQNITWLVIHIYEIALLGPSMGIVGALGLTLALGVLGDIVALKTKNVIGLGVGHIFLNITFLSYIRMIG